MSDDEDSEVLILFKWEHVRLLGFAACWQKIFELMQ